MTSIDTTLIDIIDQLLTQEQEAGRKVNGLEAISTRRTRHAEIIQAWSQVQEQIKVIKHRIDRLPSLPDPELIAWAQSVNEMDSLVFLEVDTTGIGSDSEIIRVTTANQYGSVLFDQLIKPEQARITPEASLCNGLTDADLEDAPGIVEVWPRIQRALAGQYILSFNQEWDVKTLKTAAQRHGLPQLVIIGECLQRRCTAYYFKEYYLDLATIAARMGHTMTGPDAPARLKAQYIILDSIANGITDVRPPEPEPVREVISTTGSIDDTDALGDLDDDHPF